MSFYHFPIVGIGASAGGVEALSALLTHLPPRPGAAFIVITHLAAHRVSLLPEILGRCTAMPVAAAVDGQKIEIDHVYLIPPGSILTIADGHLVLTDRHEEHNPTDILLAVLATEARERAIAVILSGSGTDGAVGIKLVHEAGGFTLAQVTDGYPPAYHGMPDAAVATGFVDCILPVAEIGPRLAELIAAAKDAPEPDSPDEPLGRAAAFAAIRDDVCALLQARVGHDFSGYKWSTFQRRLHRRMHVCRIHEPADYVAFIKDHPEEADLLFRDMLIGVTTFFRDLTSFEGLESLVLPRLFENKGEGDVVRVWVPGCATGEEAYSIAILLTEFRARRAPGPRLQVFATDVDDNALAIARLGRYPAKLLEGMAPARLARCFVREGESYAVGKEIREICLFSLHSIIRDPPFSRIDLISCRNLLIYFTLDLQNKVIPLFHYALRRGGFLFLGASEHVSQQEHLFMPLDKKRRIFQRQDLPSRPTIFPTTIPAFDSARRGPAAPERPASGGQTIVGAAQQRLIEHYAPAHVVVNADWDVVHYSGRTGKYLEPPAGAPNRNLTALARRGLSLALRSAMHEVMQTGRPTQRHNVALETEGATQLINLAIEPLTGPGESAYRLIVFTDVSPFHPADEAANPLGDREGAFVQMEHELSQTREELQTAIEEYGTSVEELKSANEELLSVNEELQSTNEELETSKEELQSVNEELHTVNNELESKVAELDRANSDLKNFFESTRIATIFLDSNMIIRRFTPAVTEVFKLLPSDCGRSLLDFVTFLDYNDLARDVRAAQASDGPLEKRLTSRDRRMHYLMRILPYRKTAPRTEGVVITFVDVTSLVQLGEQQAMNAELNHRVKNTLAIVASIAARTARRGGSLEEFMAGFTNRLDGLARTHDMLSANAWSHVGLQELVIGELTTFTETERFEAAGPAVRLQPQAGTSIGIVIHELATNAIKYGAFSNTSGHVKVVWSWRDRAEGRWLELHWQETGGPPVASPTRRGSGTDVIARTAEYEFGGTAEMSYLPGGLLVTMAMPESEICA